MDRAYLAGASGTPPAAPGSPSTGYPTAGNAGTATPATTPGPYFYHMLMEELMAIIAAAGITPAQGTLTQLLSALRSAGVFQTQALNDSTTKAATTAFANPGASVAASGYHKLPSGLIIQWGTVAVPAAENTDSTTTYAMAFGTACYSLVITDAAATANNAVVWASNNLNLANFTAHWARSGMTLAGTTRNAYYIAIGK